MPAAVQGVRIDEDMGLEPGTKSLENQEAVKSSGSMLETAGGLLTAERKGARPQVPQWRSPAMSKSMKPRTPAFWIATSMKYTQDQNGFVFVNVPYNEWELPKPGFSDPQY